MAQFTPTPMELSAIEQIETAYHDSTLNEVQRQSLIEGMWVVLERAHGGLVLSIISPEGTVIERPFRAESK